MNVNMMLADSISTVKDDPEGDIMNKDVCLSADSPENIELAKQLYT